MEQTAVRLTAPNLTIMNALLVLLIVFLAILVVLAMWGIGIYNGLVASRNRVKNAFAQIDVQLKRRYDLIPNLVEIVKKYLLHERETLEAVVQARNQAVGAEERAAANPADASALKNLSSAEAGLSVALGRLRVVSEAYPELRSNQNMLQLSEELASTENRIGFARQAYNDGVMSYNTQRETFPNVFFAGVLGFQPAELFTVDDASQREAVKVKFN